MRMRAEQPNVELPWKHESETDVADREGYTNKSISHKNEPQN